MFDLHTPPANSLVRIKQRQSLLTQKPVLNTSTTYYNSTSKPNTPLTTEIPLSSNVSKQKSSLTSNSPNSENNNISNLDDALSPAVTMRARKGYKTRY